MTRLLKVTAPDGRPIHGGDGTWSLPRQTKAGTWRPGKWWKVKGGINLCTRGLHLTTDQWVDTWLPGRDAFTVWVAEARGARDGDLRASKICVEEARLLAPVVTISAGTVERYKKRRRVMPMTLGALAKFEAEEMAVVARPGVPLVFGIHRLDEPYGPAWPTASALDGQFYRRMVRESRRILGIPEALDRAVKSGDFGAYELARTWGQAS